MEQLPVTSIELAGRFQAHELVDVCQSDAEERDAGMQLVEVDRLFQHVPIRAQWFESKHVVASSSGTDRKYPNVSPYI